MQFVSRRQNLNLLAVVALVGVFLALTGCGGAPMQAANSSSSDGATNSGQSSPTNSSSGTQNAPTQQPSNPPVQQPSNPPAPPAPPPPPPEPPSAPAPPSNAKTTAAIQTLDGWTWCTAKLNGQTCASGEGNADSSMTPKQQTPSLSGSSSAFWLGGKDTVLKCPLVERTGSGF